MTWMLESLECNSEHPFIESYRFCDPPPLLSLLYQIGEVCRRQAKCCPHCGSYNGPVKKAGPFKIYHEKFSKDRLFDMTTFEHRARLLGVKDSSKELKKFAESGEEKLLDKAQEELHPLRVLQLFKRIPDSDCYVLDTNPARSRPESLLITCLLVPPGKRERELVALEESKHNA